MDKPASQGCGPFSIQHDRFRKTLKSTDWDEFAGLTDDKQKVRFVYEKLYKRTEAIPAVEGSCNDTTEVCKNGSKALEMKKSGNEYFQKSDYRNALNWYSQAVINCPQNDGWYLMYYHNIIV